LANIGIQWESKKRVSFLASDFAEINFYPVQRTWCLAEYHNAMCKVLIFTLSMKLFADALDCTTNFVILDVEHRGSVLI